MSIQATLSIYSPQLIEGLRNDIDRTGEFGIVPENSPSEILSEAIALIALDTYINSNSLNVTHIGIIRKKKRVTASQVKLLVTDVLELPTPISVDNLAQSMPAKFRKLTKFAFGIGYNGIGHKTGEKLFEKIVELYPDNAGYFNGLVNKIGQSAMLSGANRTEDAAFEKDALGLCLDVFMDGTKRQRILRSWEQENNHGIGHSFLSGLHKYRAYEDDIINHDMRAMPGMEIMMASASGIVEFKNDYGEKLLVINANRKPLEKAYGVDLIYFSRQHQAFTFVQYKMMENHGEDKDYYNPSESSHDQELQRMIRLQGYIDGIKKDVTLADYRFSNCPIFFKVCKRLQLNQNDGSIAMGAYIPLDQWNLLLNDKSILGSKGGRQIGFHTLKRRYVGTTMFVELVKRGLIGTHSLASEKVAEYIEEVIERGHSVLYAIDDSMRNVN